MADDSSSLQQFVNIPTILAFLTIVGGVIWFQPFLNTSRPPSTADQGDTRLATVEARLWQDPYEATQKHEDTLGTNDLKRTDAESITALAGAVTGSVLKPTDLTVLSIMETAKPYADDHESRLKSRYAVVSALGAAGFVPEDADHIRYFAICRTNANDNDWAQITDSVSNTASKLLVPFEWFSHSSLRREQGKPNNTRVLVLWLDDDAFQSRPLERLANLMKMLTPGLSSASNISFNVIGPRSSGRLAEMAADNYPVTSACCAISTNNFSIYSIWATAADALLYSNSFPNQLPRQAIGEKLRDTNKVAFRNMACTDDQLAGALIHELKLRNVDLVNSTTRNSVVLVSEWDTFYGRALPLTFAAKVSSDGADRTDVLGPPAFTKQWPEQISKFSYLKGVDGTLPTANRTKKAGGNNNPANAGDLLRPEGDSQLDYIPRLSWKLNQFDWLDRTPGQHAVKAIGVLGSDVYDKLLLLQALRQDFPTAILFTTDLDARLLDSSQWKWTRNLIVASSFGLELSRELQGEIPPFRDCYQTAQFLACRVALGELDTNLLQQLKPHVYEVGRTAALDLESLTRPPDQKDGQPILYPTWQYHASKMRWVERWACLATVCGVVLAGLVGARITTFTSDNWVNPDKRKFWIEGTHRKTLVAVVAVGILAEFALGLRVHCDQWANGAPFSLWEGTSVWPAEFLRLLVVFLGLGILLHAHFASKVILNKVEDVFFPKDEPKPAIPTPEATVTNRPESMAMSEYLRKTFLDIRVKALHYEKDPGTGSEDGNIKDLFAKYRVLARTSNHYKRVSLKVVLYLLFYVCLFLIFGFPYVPIRGAVSRQIDMFIMMTAVVVTTLIIFYIADVTWLCARFVQLLQDRKSQWPTKASEKFATKRGMYRSDSNESGEPQKAKLQDVAEWIDIQMIARLTGVVGRLIYYPFVILFLMIVARSPWFARWDWPLPLILALGTNALYALYSGHTLRTTAEQGRSAALVSLRRRLSEAISMENKPRADQIRLIIEDVKSMKEGAFAPWSERPVLRALLIPFGGSGLLALIQYLATMK